MSHSPTHHLLGGRRGERGQSRVAMKQHNVILGGHQSVAVYEPHRQHIPLPHKHRPLRAHQEQLVPDGGMHTQASGRAALGRTSPIPIAIPLGC